MKLVQVLYSGLGGHGSVAFSLARSIEGFHWTNAMVFIGIEPLLPAYRAIASGRGVEYAAVRTRPGMAWLAWVSLYRALARSRPDAIVLHSVKTILPCAVYAMRHRIPLLAVEHQANALKRRAEWWVSRWLMRLADGIVVLTPAYRQQLQDGLGAAWRAQKVHVIPNGIDTTAFAPASRHAPDTGCRAIGMAARITGIKRQELLVDALALLCARDGRDAWRLTLAGDGDELEALRAKVRQSRLEDVVSLPGFLDEAALGEWFHGLHIYAHASEGETLSTSLLQAMAMGLPIVGSDVTGIGELLSSGGGVGIVVPQTPQAFADAFTRIRDEAGLATALGARARRLVEQEYSQQMMADRYRRQLEALCTR